VTPSLARMIAQKQGELALPGALVSFGPFWRYEKMQKGRSREILPVEHRYAWESTPPKRMPNWLPLPPVFLTSGRPDPRPGPHLREQPALYGWRI